jgi:hypothetical protein
MNELLGMSALVGAAVVFGVLPSAPLDNCDPASARAQSIRRAELRGTAMLAIGGLTAALALHACTRGAWGIGALVVLLGIATALALQPAPIVRAVLVPMGAWRLARMTSKWGGPPWLRDPEGGAALMAVLAARNNFSQSGALDEIETELFQAPLRGAGLVACGLIADLRGQAAEARRLLISVDALDPDVCPPLARAIANDWLLEDAATRDRWTEVQARSENALALSASGRLLQTIARRLLGHASRWELLRAWLSAPGRWKTWALLENAWDEPVLPNYPVVDEDIAARAANGYGLAGTGAPSLHLEAVKAHAQGELSSQALERLGRAWDETLWDIGLRKRVRARSMQLDCNLTVEESMVEMHRALCVEVAAMMPPVGDIPRGGKTLTGAAELFSAAQEHRIQQALARLAEASQASISPTAVQLWYDWLEVQDGYTLHRRADVSEARPLFMAIDAKASTLVHWLWHERGERPMANAIATWLALEAERIQEAEAAAYHRQYVAAGP